MSIKFLSQNICIISKSHLYLQKKNKKTNTKKNKNNKTKNNNKFGVPCGSQTWYILEGEKQDDDYILFALLDNMGEREYGYVSLNELQRVRTRPFGLGIERDMYFTPCKVSEIN